ncbi:hypothetical protein A1Q1_02278 [Trichosporon asahii var. asahii CBS 2479]|uniref:Integrase catalytic domain-containing protein n=1 Tax=Trichosporon asahii var. asahii (strain ATCC 90039 / CBS 2479 / JCM 2466 / KCTC 7840 / NBRC 103889/ NCYC 2677 / UAMH 7654) TaxID=1186058 RepID=J5QRI8_TRIAS|nr:hypothetical protein A1Q1_02278 [Trichosporon asahii var. asahii CBS 2479]EJT48733.1 hypothetical protein A1Q1_02278 [Trichosporon asahii var. asahii CBS 2479]
MSTTIDFVLDTGAGAHIVKDAGLLVNIRPVRPTSFCAASEDSSFVCRKVGDMYIETDKGRIVIEHVYYAPRIVNNLLSYGRLKTKGWECDKAFTILNFSDPPVFSTPVLWKDNVSHINLSVMRTRTTLILNTTLDADAPKTPKWPHSIFEPVYPKSPLQRIHEQTSHTSRTALIRLARQGEIAMTAKAAMEDPFRVTHCNACMSGLIKPIPDAKGYTPRGTSLQNEMLHFDLGGPFPLSEAGDGEMVFFWKMDFTNIGGAEKIPSKKAKHVASMLKKIVIRAQRQGINIVRVRSDNELLNNMVAGFCDSVGIDHQTSPPYEHKYNGVAETWVGIVKARARTLLLSTLLGHQFWEYAIRYAVAAINKTSTSGVPGKTPWQLWTDRRPQVDRMLEFGKFVYVYVSEESGRRLKNRLDQPIGQLGRVIGMPVTTTGFEVRLEVNGVIVTSANIVVAPTIPISTPLTIIQNKPPKAPRSGLLPDRPQIDPIGLEDTEYLKAHPHLRTFLEARTKPRPSAPRRPVDPSMMIRDQSLPRDSPQPSPIADSAAAPAPEHRDQRGLLDDGDEDVRQLQPPLEPAQPQDEVHTSGPSTPKPTPRATPGTVPPVTPKKEPTSKRHSDLNERAQGEPYNLRTRPVPAPDFNRTVSAGPTASKKPKRKTTTQKTAISRREKGPGLNYTEPTVLTTPGDRRLPYRLCAVGASIAQTTRPTPVPRSLPEALRSPSAPQWKEALDRELNQLEEKGTWEEVVPPDGAKIIGSKVVFDLKTNEKGDVIGHKARVVARGDCQDFIHDSFNGVVRMASIRALMAIAAAEDLEIHQADIIGAYLNGVLEDKNIYMKFPPGYVKTDPRATCLRLIMTIYGLRESGKIWGRAIAGQLVKQGFTILSKDKGLYAKILDDGTRMIIALFVDDMMIAAKRAAAITAFLDVLHQVYPLKRLGEVRHLLGMTITRDRPARTISISLEPYIREVAARFPDLDTRYGRFTPLPHQLDQLSDHESLNNIKATRKYQAIVGSIMWASNTARPDIQFASGWLATALNNPSAYHMSMAYRVLAHLYNTKDYVLTLGGASKPLRAYTDAAHADAPGSRSTEGSLIFLGPSLVEWRSKRQRVVAKSTMESEYIAASEATADVQYWRQWLRDIGQPAATPIELFIDNMSAKQFAENEKMKRNTRHIDIAKHHIKQYLEDNSLKLQHVSSADQLADIMTKSLPPATHETIRTRLNVLPPP